jgi:cytochrome P450
MKKLPTFDGGLLFAHPDDTREIDARDDPMAEISAALHAAGPVIKGRGFAKNGGAAVEFAGITFPNIMTPPSYTERGAYCAVGWEAVRSVYTNRAFSSKVFEDTVGKMWGPALSPMDPPEHTKYRAIMQKGFTPGRIKNYEDRIIRPVIARRFDAIKRDGRADLVPQVNSFYPFEVVGGIVGFDPTAVEFVGACFYRMWQANVDPVAAMEASNALKDYTKALIDSRRGEPPRDDLVSAMMEAEVGGAPLSAERLNGMIVHFMAGGIDTTFKQSGILAHTLLSHPEQFDRLKKDRSLIPAAVEECIRYEGIGNLIVRQAAEDTEVCGTLVPKGAIMFLMHGVTNRDPGRWSNPDVFDIDRPPQQQIQFGNGPHACIGQHLARFMLARYVEHLIDDLPGLRWDPGLDAVPKITGWTQRTALSVPVVWDVA